MKKLTRVSPGSKSTNDARDYAVGYGKPPASGKFKPGQSGNPKGRPKRPIDLVDRIGSLMNQKIKVIEGDTQKTIPRFEAMMRRLMNLALKGDKFFISLLLDRYEQYLARSKITEKKRPTIYLAKFQSQELDILESLLLAIEARETMNQQ